MNKNQNDSKCSCEHCETQKKFYKKIFGFVSSRFLFFAIGFFISVAVLTAYAAWNDDVVDGGVLTAAKWNDVVDHVENMETEMDGEWKMLAQGSDWTEEALITLQAAGPSFDTDHDYADQKVNIGTFNWPQSGVVKEIIFKINNRGDDYCAGGGFTLNLGSNVESAGCQDWGYQGTILTPWEGFQDDGIQIAIDGVDMAYCPDQYGRVSSSATYKGTIGHRYWGTQCYYKATVDYASQNINKIEIKEYDHSPDFGIWEWEIWYK